MIASAEKWEIVFLNDKWIVESKGDKIRITKFKDCHFDGMVELDDETWDDLDDGNFIAF